MGNVIHHVETADILFMQEINSMRVLFAKDRNQDIRAIHLFLAHPLHMQDGALDYALEAKGRLRIGLALRRQHRHIVTQKGDEATAQLFNVSAAGA